MLGYSQRRIENMKKLDWYLTKADLKPSLKRIKSFVKKYKSENCDFDTEVHRWKLISKTSPSSVGDGIRWFECNKNNIWEISEQIFAESNGWA